MASKTPTILQGSGAAGSDHPIESSARPRRLISKRQLLERFPLSFPTIWKMMCQGRFPRARIIGGKSVWFEEEIDAFLDTLPPRRYKNAASPDVKIGKNWSDNFTKQKGKR
jgi:predicted DNA-binding transcriptional regulator AlpA